MSQLHEQGSPNGGSGGYRVAMRDRSLIGRPRLRLLAIACPRRRGTAVNRRKIFLPIAVIGAVALAISGCSSGGGSGAGSGDKNAEFEFWSFTGIGQKDSVAQYLKKNPDAKVKLSEV